MKTRTIDISLEKLVDGRVEIASNALQLDGKRHLIYSGEIQYYRIPHTEWKARLHMAKALGINCVSTYVPWNWHERSKGQYDWAGDRNLGKFLELCHQEDLLAIVKPGPYICSEWDNGGFPHWLIRKNLRVRSMDEQYLELVRQWFIAAIKEIRPHLYGNSGAVILFQIENEYEHFLENNNDSEVKHEESKAYLSFLIQLAKNQGIDVPLYLNGSPKLSKDLDLLDAVDFWPDIPFLWRNEFNLFNSFLDKHESNDKPLFISELQAGWYDQIGEPHYEASEIIAPNIRNAIGRQVSMINLFMLAGGTTSPMYACKGDTLISNGTENTTSYDFGAPISENGEYCFSKAAEVVIGRKLMETYEECIFAGGQDLLVLISTDGTEYVGSESENMANHPYYLKSPLHRAIRSDKQGFLYIHNPSEIPQTFCVKQPELDGLEVSLEAWEAKILPYRYKLNGDIEIISSDTEMVVEKFATQTVAIFVSNGSSSSTIIFNVAIGVEPNLPDGALRIGSATFKLTARNSPINVFALTPDIHIMFVNRREFPFLNKIDNLVLFSTGLLLENIQTEGAGAEIHYVRKPGRKILLNIYSPLDQKYSVVLDDKSQKKFYLGPNEGLYSVKFSDRNMPEHDTQSPIAVAWDTPWRMRFLDQWLKARSHPRFTRKLRIYDSIESFDNPAHGYIYYQIPFKLADPTADYQLKVQGKTQHTLFIYLNGNLLYSGCSLYSGAVSRYLKNLNLLTIKYLYHHHTKGYHNSGPALQFSGIQNLSLSCTLEQSALPLNYANVVNLPLDDLSGFFAGATTSLRTLHQTLKLVCLSADLVHLTREFSMIQKDYARLSMALEIENTHARALIFVNDTLVGKFDARSPQYSFYIPSALLKTKNKLDLILDGGGLDRLGRTLHPEFGGVNLIWAERMKIDSLVLQPIQSSSARC